MAATPESKVKDKVKKILKEYGAYYAMPVASGFGHAGVPDILACYKGQFLGIECKANGGKATALQLSNLEQIRKAGGVSMIIDELSIPHLTAILDTIKGQTTNEY
jgi:Holliday junction resolvase